MVAILFSGAQSFEQIDNILSTKVLMWNLVKIAQMVSEKKTFKNYTNFIQVCSPGAGADNLQGTKFSL